MTPATPPRHRPVWAEVDLSAVRDNAAHLLQTAAPARLCAVVKAGAYGHGAVEAARAALDGGASWLAVALVEEGEQLRQAGVDAPVLVLSEPPLDAMPDVVRLRLRPTVYTHGAVEAAAKAAVAAGDGPLPVHVKVDTGMHRVGAAPTDAVQVARQVTERPELQLEGFWTHFALADVVDDAFTSEQVSRFRSVVAELSAVGIRPPILHASNSAGALAHPDARFDMVRCGIALYGVAPSARMEPVSGLRPALSLRARVSYVKEVAAGDGVSYGLHYRFDRPTVVATVPIGYADGVPWRLGPAKADVLVGGRRRTIAGSVTMDQITVDCGDDRTVTPGDEVALLGSQGSERIGAWEWANAAGTIAYEVMCGIGARVPKVYV